MLRVGGLLVNTAAFRGSCHGEALDLTAAELRLLALLMRDPGRVRVRAELLSVVSGPAAVSDERTVDAHVKNLRRKLGRCGSMVETVRGVGYRLAGG